MHFKNSLEKEHLLRFRYCRVKISLQRLLSEDRTSTGWLSWTYFLFFILWQLKYPRRALESAPLFASHPPAHWFKPQSLGFSLVPLLDFISHFHSITRTIDVASKTCLNSICFSAGLSLPPSLPLPLGWTICSSFLNGMLAFYSFTHKIHSPLTAQADLGNHPSMLGTILI